MSMTLNFLGGAPFQLLYDGVKLAMSNTRKFKTHLRSLKFTLDCLQPQIIEQIRLQNLQLNIPVQEIQELQRKIDEGIVLVGRLSRIDTCNIRVWGSCCNCLMVSYADQLDELNESLRRLLEILRLQSLAQVNQIAILARTTRDRQDELGSRQLEILSNQRRIIETLMQQQQIIERIEKIGVAASAGKEEGAVPVQVLRLGAVFQALFDAVVQVKVKNSKFKRLLEDFKFTLDCLKPLVQEIVECNKVLHFPKEEILDDFIVYLDKGVELVYKCSRTSLWTRFKKYEYINNLFELDESLQRLFNTLRLQIENDVNDALVSVSKLEKEIKEIEDSFVLQHHQYESAAAELQMPKVESDVMNVQETRDVKQSMDPTGNVEVGDGSRKQFGGSSQALQRIDVAVEEHISPTTALDVVSNPEILDSARNSMEVGLEETGGKGKSERETRLDPCKAVEKETLAPIVPVLASQKRNASLVTVLLSCVGISENQSRSTVSQISYAGISEIQSRSTVSQTSSSTGRSQFSHFTEATTSTLSPRYDDYQESTDGEILETSKLRVFSFADLKSATKNFKSDQILGEGGFGRVFKGWVDEETLQPCKAGTGMMVAVKKLNPESMLGFQEWQSEVNYLGRLSHPNLVKLMGYCWEDKELLLVYEFMQKGSLENHLFRRSPNIEPLSWDLRIRIAIGAARGLAFLHSSEKQIIYRDFKASNIFLDGNYNARISDFGLAKLGPTGGDTHVSTRVMGTYGYAAPEYIATGHLCVKSDVYGFGVVLLEILTGLRALDTKRPREQRNLVDWAKPLLPHRRKLKTIMDARMEGQYSFKAAVQTANITLKCLAPDPKSRPSMKEVLEELEQVQAIREKPKPALLNTFRQPTSSPRSYVLQEPPRRTPLHSRYQAIKGKENPS